MTVLRGSKEPYDWQKEVDGWYIYSNMGNDTKIEVLKDLGKFVDMPVIIEPVSKSGITSSSTTLPPKVKRNPQNTHSKVQSL